MANCEDCKKTSNIVDMYLNLCRVLKDLRDYFVNKREYNTPDIELIDVGGSITIDAADYHSITITVIHECDSITVNGETITDVPKGYSFTYTATTLLDAEIEVDCTGKGKVIINFLR